MIDVDFVDFVVDDIHRFLYIVLHYCFPKFSIFGCRNFRLQKKKVLE